MLSIQWWASEAPHITGSQLQQWQLTLAETPSTLLSPLLPLFFLKMIPSFHFHGDTCSENYTKFVDFDHKHLEQYDKDEHTHNMDHNMVHIAHKGHNHALSEGKSEYSSMEEESYYWNWQETELWRECDRGYLTKGFRARCRGRQVVENASNVRVEEGRLGCVAREIVK